MAGGLRLNQRGSSEALLASHPPSGLLETPPPLSHPRPRSRSIQPSSLSFSVSSTPDRERCQKELCRLKQEAYLELKADHKQLQCKYDNQKRSYKSDVAKSDAAQALAAALLREEQHHKDLAEAQRSRKYAVRIANELAAERRDCVKESARLALALKVAARRLTTLNKDHAVELRSWKMECNKVVADADGLASALAAALQVAEAAGVRAEKAESETVHAMARLAEAEHDFDEATEAGMEAE